MYLERERERERDEQVEAVIGSVFGGSKCVDEAAESGDGGVYLENGGGHSAG